MGDRMDEEEIEEMRKKLKEERYLRSLSLPELGGELRRAEKMIERCREIGDEDKLERMEEYRDKLKKKINGRMESIELNQNEK